MTYKLKQEVRDYLIDHGHPFIEDEIGDLEYSVSDLQLRQKHNMTPFVSWSLDSEALKYLLYLYDGEKEYGTLEHALSDYTGTSDHKSFGLNEQEKADIIKEDEAFTKRLEEAYNNGLYLRPKMTSEHKKLLNKTDQMVNNYIQKLYNRLPKEKAIELRDYIVQGLKFYRDFAVISDSHIPLTLNGMDITVNQKEIIQLLLDTSHKDSNIENFFNIWSQTYNTFWD